MNDRAAHPDRHVARSGAKYVFALVALLVLTALTFGLHYVPFGGVFGVLVALVIATIKVLIVASIFMELRESTAASRMVAIVSIAFVMLLCLGIVGDVAFR